MIFLTFQSHSTIELVDTMLPYINYLGTNSMNSTPLLYETLILDN